MKKLFFIFLFCLLTNQIYSYEQSAYQDLLKGDKNLAGKDLSGIDFSGRAFKGIDFKGINLKKANLSKTKIFGLNLQKANLNQANLYKAHLKDVNAKKASFLGASFKKSTLENIDFSNARLGGSIKVKIKRGHIISFQTLKTNFFKARFKGVKFKNVIFDVGSRKEDRYKKGGTSFYECQMDNVIFDESFVKKLELNKCNVKNGSFKNLKLEGAYKDPISFYLGNSKLDGCSFTDDTFKNKYAVYSMPKTIMLRSTGLSKAFERQIKERGAYISAYSTICCADLHLTADVPVVKFKIKQVKKMVETAKNKGNRVNAVIYAGDLCERGDKKDWNLFLKHYYNKLKKYVKYQFFCVGNHDRWTRSDPRSWIKMVFRAATGKPSYAVEHILKHYCKISGNSKWKKGYYKFQMNGTDFVSLDECPTMPNNEPINWFVKEVAKDKYPKILFFHYTQLQNWSVGWWTQKKGPRPTNTKRGKRAVDYFYRKLKPFKKDIILMFGGHDHTDIYRNWRDIPSICVNSTTSVLAHIDPSYPKKINNKWQYFPELIALEFIFPTKKTQTYYPCLEKIDEDHEKETFIIKAYREILGRAPDSSGLRYYIKNWNKIGGSWDIEQELKKSPEYIKKEINKFYEEYLGRKGDSSGLSHYIKVWKKEGRDKVESYIKNLKKAQPKLLKKWYKDYLGRKLDKKGEKYYLDNWHKLGGADKVRDNIRNSKEARPKLLKKWYKDYFEREIDEGGKKFWLGQWNELKADKVEDAIKNSLESKVYQRKMYGK